VSAPCATLERSLIDEAGYGRAPRACVDSGGRLWVGWIAWDGERERVRLCTGDAGGSLGAPIDVAPARRLVTGLSLAPWRDGVLVAWVDGDDPLGDGLKLMAVGSDGRAVSPALVCTWAEAPEQPCLSARGDAFVLGWTSRAAGARRARVLLGSDPTATGGADAVGTGGNERDPAVVVIDGGAWVAWASFDTDGGRIVARRIHQRGQAGEPIVIDGGGGSVCAQPALVRSPAGGAWIAWQSDRDPARGPGLVRWIEVAHLGSDGGVARPVDAMPGADRQGHGEDQGFEAPSLAVGGDDRLIVVGRGSQSIGRQDLGAAGWTARLRVDEPGWKCRGRRFEVAAAAGGVFVVGRERDGIAVRRLATGEPGNGGMARLAPWREVGRGPASTATARRPAEIAGRSVLFGDIHQHTAASDGTGTWAETFARAGCRYLDDLVAVADHESFLGKRTSPGEWALARSAADDFTAMGPVVVLHAFEWTGKMHPGPGHKVVYLPAGGGPVLSRDDERASNSAGLVAACREIGALVFPHHVGWTGADMDSHDPRVQTCFEIVSCHGAYERAGVGPISTRGDDKPGQFVGDALDAGLRFGLVGGSDGHGLNWHHGVCRLADSHRSGLTAVFADAPTREAVLDALGARRCYATSGAKIRLWFEIDGRPMGSEIAAGAPVECRVQAIGTAPFASASLVTTGGAEIALAHAADRVDARLTLDPPAPETWAYFYVRLVQEDGQVAWSSPIWMDRPVHD